ncbi:MAG TPA: helix-turn-helix transcriptional regulator, partial [Allosphingosinicella sp.]
MADADQDQLLGQSVGERLRIAREAKKLSLDDVARQTRIPVRHLEHIEREEWDALPAITYSVGFARSYANTVDLDGAKIGAEVRQQLGGIRAGHTAAAPFYEPTDPARVPPRSIAIAAAVIAVLLVIGYLVWRSGAVGEESPADVAITQADEPAAANQAAARPARPVVAAPPPSNGPVVLTAAEDVWLRIDQAGGGAPLYMGTLKGG